MNIDGLEYMGYNGEKEKNGLEMKVLLMIPA
jgi:hypothetical protein